MTSRYWDQSRKLYEFVLRSNDVQSLVQYVQLVIVHVALHDEESFEVIVCLVWSTSCEEGVLFGAVDW